MIAPTVAILLLIHAVSGYVHLDFVGCYKDTPNRYLKNKMQDVGSVQECVGICSQQRYPYAGLQYGKQCFCGSYYGRDRSYKCNMKCRQSWEMCGGSYSNSVYRTGSSQGSGGGGQGSGGLQSLGCWKDKSDRVLEVKLSDVRGVRQCVRRCRKRGYRYAGVEFGKQCFCGSSSYRTYGRSYNCDMRCKNDIDYCGGYWAINVYRARGGHGGPFEYPEYPPEHQPDYPPEYPPEHQPEYPPYYPPEHEPEYPPEYEPYCRFFSCFAREKMCEREREIRD